MLFFSNFCTFCAPQDVKLAVAYRCELGLLGE